MGDSSQCRRLENHFHEAKQNEADELVAGLVRDINNVLTAISAYGAMLFEDLLSGPQREMVSEIKKLGEHGAVLTRQLRQLHSTATWADAGRGGGGSGGGRESILLVEDNEAVRGMAARTLRSSGYLVLEASTGEEALSIGERHDTRIDLLLTDVVLPGMNGRALAYRLSVRHPRVRTLLMSGYPPDEAAPSDVLPVEVDYLMKPFNCAILAAKVREVLDAT
jgi:CheY-like chemotaxis protein